VVREKRKAGWPPMSTSAWESSRRSRTSA